MFKGEMYCAMVFLYSLNSETRTVVLGFESNLYINFHFNLKTLNFSEELSVISKKLLCWNITFCPPSPVGKLANQLLGKNDPPFQGFIFEKPLLQIFERRYLTVFIMVCRIYTKVVPVILNTILKLLQSEKRKQGRPKKT